MGPAGGLINKTQQGEWDLSAARGACAPRFASPLPLKLLPQWKKKRMKRLKRKRRKMRQRSK
eukprot:NODE_3201_length_478_cov_900.752914_g2780_i0.p3 GENE.NODE_3201_length_478_cov_900.752914_g2780_i0~~NODE_3201_length_478_cov_900.752914_g2780_i0.p3  ORF type:complete len:62 (-),score=10.13 NODE_3201_length_478_cov_900.752914_g2780_i0:153-338(-)